MAERGEESVTFDEFWKEIQELFSNSDWKAHTCCAKVIFRALKCRLLFLVVEIHGRVGADVSGTGSNSRIVLKKICI